MFAVGRVRPSKGWSKLCATGRLEFKVCNLKFQRCKGSSAGLTLQCEREMILPISIYGNPVLRQKGAPIERITRPEFVDVTATNLKGEKFSFRAGGLLSRAVQHEIDHLNGILFIDRMTAEAKSELKPELEALQSATKAALKGR